MDNIQKLIEMFKEFPGIGPRQAKRFVYFLLNKNPGYIKEMSRLITEVPDSVRLCETCFRFFPMPTGRQANGSKQCSICSDNNREKSLMLVSHDVDFENIEKTGFYKGYYFILGGSIPILEKNPEKRIREKDLLDVVDKRAENGLEEIIMALNYNPEGENTLSYLREILDPIVKKHNIKISTLGRGLSTGTELEYSDTETIKNALKNRQ